MADENKISDLKDEIISILNEKLRALSISEITSLINQRGNYEQLDGSPISDKLVENKIKTFPQFFLYEKGLVSLIDWENLGDIRDVLLKENRKLNTKEIAEKINQSKSSDEDKITPGQVFLRVKRYPSLFMIEGDEIELLAPQTPEEKTEIEIRKKEKPIEAQKVFKRVIKEISVGNFKAIANKQSIAIKPITLIFGPNSSGKSSIIHSLLYIHNAFATGDLDPHYMKISGNSVDLGGFNQFVYKRKIETPIEWGIKISNSEFSKRLKEILFQTEEVSINVAISQSYTERTKKVYDKENNKYVEIPTGELISRGSPQVTKYEIFTDNTLFLKMSMKSNKQMTIDFINLEHEAINQILKAIIEAKTSVLNFDENEIHILRNAAQEVCEKIYTENNSFIPKNFSSLKIDLLESIEQIFAVSKENREKDLKNAVETFFPRLLNEILEGVYNSIDKTLGNLIYLGPLRSYPERHISFTKYNDPNWQAGGGLAWEIVRDNELIRNTINNWLENEEKLKTPYRLEVRKLIDTQSPDIIKILDGFKEYLSRDVEIDISDILELIINKDFSSIDESLIKEKFDNYIDQFASELVDLSEIFEGSDVLNDLVLIDKRSDTVVSHRDVGIGISQVLPVLAYAYSFKDRIITIEQPEIHLHPALQAELADVFIETAIKNNNTYLLETHSEHFILRILRRIREGYANNNPELKIEDVNVVYVKPTEKGSIVYQIPVTADGDFETHWPDGFFPERGEELFL